MSDQVQPAARDVYDPRRLHLNPAQHSRGFVSFLGEPQNSPRKRLETFYSTQNGRVVDLNVNSPRVHYDPPWVSPRARKILKDRAELNTSPRSHTAPENAHRPHIETVEEKKAKYKKERKPWHPTSTMIRFETHSLNLVQRMEKDLERRKIKDEAMRYIKAGKPIPNEKNRPPKFPLPMINRVAPIIVTHRPERHGSNPTLLEIHERSTAGGFTRTPLGGYYS
eukprot:GFYU01003478.1.p1 GENE.GFYU01003478.1~~GFYU01003478.1.p1  ORF type:complete len:223 (+),score=27.40 GFYU01003478.1:136-804(+)